MEESVLEMVLMVELRLVDPGTLLHQQTSGCWPAEDSCVWCWLMPEGGGGEGWGEHLEQGAGAGV